MRKDEYSWDGPLEIHGADDHMNRRGQDIDYLHDQMDNRAGGGAPRPSDEVKQGWLLKPENKDEAIDEKKKRVMMCKNMCANYSVTIRSLVMVAIVVAIITGIVKLAQRNHRHPHPALPDNYTTALHQALIFFNAQRAGKLPKDNNVSWRGDSCLSDGDSNTTKNLVGGYYDGADASKLSFPASFAMTMLSWSVIEYSAKYEAIGELEHVKDIIKWGTDYLLKTFNSSADSHSIGKVVTEVTDQLGDDGYDNKKCWIRPEDIDHPRMGQECYNCPALAAEMASALASASIVFKDNANYSQKLVHGADILFQFATKGQGAKYSGGSDPFSPTYNSTGFWDEFVWGGSWLYLATGNSSYLQLVTSPDLVAHERSVWADADPHYKVLSWDNKHAGAFVLLSRLRLLLSYGYPYEEMLRKYHKQVDDTMCAYLPAVPQSGFSRTKGGLIQLNNGRPRPLEYVVHAAFLAHLYSDYIEAVSAPGWHCGTQFYSKEQLRKFARTQIDYILGKNPEGMSYIVGFGERFPKQVHHRGASIPNNKIKYGCKGGLKWRDTNKPNPNTIVGAMVAGPDKHDSFHDIRFNYNYTEPSLTGNAGLVAALVAALSTTTGGNGNAKANGIDKNSIFYALPPL